MRSSIVLFAVLVFAAFPSTAFGSLLFVHHKFAGAIYDASGGEANELTVSETAGTITVIDPGAVIVAQSPCVQVSDHEATCAGVTSFFALLNDLNDSASVLMRDEVSMNLQRGDGNDELTLCSACDGDLLGGAGKDVLHGGNEGSLLFGGTGPDTLTGGAARDIIDGEAGGDFIAGRAGGDTIAGGPGSDTLRGNRGNDQLRARDAFSDFVGGGRGFDRARVGESDVVRSIERLFF